ncbi:MAG: hypothetical protein HY092_04310 [Candidatus Kerfeldbacteria bacterium]|nr:hypothetical protein [Candidatus Kerfeldbacteria bacterium]
MTDEVMTPANSDPNSKNRAILAYIVENCIFAYDELCRVNKELINRANPDSNLSMNHLGAMNRMIQDYLIVRVAGLFDEAEYVTKGGIDEVISFDKLFADNQDYQKIKEQQVIKYIIDQRHNFVAHTNTKHIEKNFPVTFKICNSNLRELLKSLQELVKN